MKDPDPKGLIAEAFSMEGLTGADCRVIFLQWAMTAPDSGPEALRELLARHGAAHPGHAMTLLIESGLADAPPPRRRGRRR
jgi:hypothetical protein